MSSNDPNTRMVLSFLKDDIDNINMYVNEILNREYKSFESVEEIIEYFNDYMNGLLSNLSYKELDNIRYYTGYNYRDINAVYRNNWNYDTNGHIDRRKEYEGVCKDIEESFAKLPSLPGDIVVYRGVDLTPFKSYGINTIEDLVNMNGEFMYELGLTSTSLLQSSSFYDKELGNHSSCNVLLEYYIPRECSDAIPLLTDDLSYSTSQNELLINPGSLTKIFDVEISEDKTKAILKVAYVPVRLWDPQRKEQKETIQR